MPTFSDYFDQQSGGAVQPLSGAWIQLVSNLTGATYVSTSATSAQGLATVTAPPGDYTVNTGPSSSGPWTATGDIHYTVANRDNWFNASDFGAIGNGVADDTSAIQAAINACQNAGGGVVLLSQGTFRTTSALQITANVRVVLMAWGATLLPAANIDGVFVSQNNGATSNGCEIYGLTINGQNNVGTVGIRVRDTDRCALRNVRIINCATGHQVEQFAVSHWAEENSLEDVFIWNCTTGINVAGVSAGASLGEQHWFNVGISGCATGIALNNNIVFYRCRLIGVTIWLNTNGVGLKLDCDVRDSVFVIDFENNNGTATNLTGVNVTANAANLDKLQAHFAFTGTFATQVSDATPKGLVWSDGIHWLTTAAYGGIIQDWGLNTEGFPRVRVGPSFAGGGGIQFGIGSSSPDVSLFRTGLATLGITGAFARSRQTPTETVLVSGVDVTAGEHVSVTLSAARLVGAPLNPQPGDHLYFTLIQNSTGGFAVTWNAIYKVSWSDTGNTANKRSTIGFWYDGGNWNQLAAQAPYV